MPVRHNTEHMSGRTAGEADNCRVEAFDAPTGRGGAALAAAVARGPWGTCTDTHTGSMFTEGR